MRNILLLGAVACLASSQEEQAGASRLLEHDRAFFAETRERGLEGWLDWFTPDAVVLTAKGELLSGADEMRAYYESIAFPPAGFTWKPESGELAESGDLGYTIGSWLLLGPGESEDDGKARPGGRYLTIWKRQPGGSFLVVTDSGGEPDFRTRIDELDGPPLEWSSATERSEVSESGELAYAMGTWEARTAQSKKVGRFLTVWKRTGAETWEIAAEIGFDH